METINYQGKEVQADRVAEILGFTARPFDGNEREGQDQLWRDEAGRYYVNRVTWNARYGKDATKPQSSRNFTRDARRFETTHRLSLNQVALWMALMFTETNAVQIDLAKALMESREAERSAIIVAGSVAMTLSDEALAKVTKFAQMTNSDVRDVVETVVTNGMSLFTEDDDGTGDPRLSESWASFTADVQDERDRRLAVLDHGQTRASAMKWNTSEDLADGGMVICLHLKPEPARLMRAACLLDETSPVETIYHAMASDVNSAFSGGGREEEAAREAIFDDNAPEKEEPSSGMAVRLDKEATEMVQRYLKATPRDYTIGDVVSGAVIETMEGALENLPEAIEWGCLDGDRFHDGAWGYLDDKIMRAQFRREDRDPGEIDEMNWFRSPAEDEKETVQPQCDRNAQPDFSLNAAAPERVDTPKRAKKAKRSKAGKEEA